jgi:hypothetical protein
MAIVRYDRAIASVSWIDWHSGLPEVDTDPPGAQVARSYLMGAFGFRFVNYLEVWASYDTASETMVGYGFSPASGIYRAPTYAGYEAATGGVIRDLQVGHEPIVFYQMLGALMDSPDKTGTVHLPPMWTELELRLYNDGRIEGRVLRHSLFPSVSFYVSKNDAPGAPISHLYRVPQQSATHPVTLVPCYNGLPNLQRWRDEGWGPMLGRGPGPTPGNPWGLEEVGVSGMDIRRASR